MATIARPLPTADAAVPHSGAALPAGRPLWRRFVRNRPAVIGLCIIVLMLALAALAEVIAPYDWRAQDIINRFSGPSPQHLLGTDELGRDILSRVLYGARFSLTIGFGAVAISLAIGTLVGLVAGFYRGVDGVIMRVVDIMMAFPGILLAIAIVAALGPGLTSTIVAIGVNEIPGFARLNRSLALSLREREYVMAARVLGAPDRVILGRHVLLNLISPLIVFASLRMATAILVGATLSFLGLGVQPPVPEWGAMVSTARQYIATAPHTFVYPTLAIFITVVGFNLLGDGLRDALDPTLRD
ncbi:MAG TPA: ABC transporter permease [Acetobacteraceae bacterium]|nr:ABC transporter permease [Acetobacteraceae bacterium]